MSKEKYIELIGSAAVGATEGEKQELGEHKLVVESGIWVPDYPIDTVNVINQIASYGNRFFRVAEAGIDVQRPTSEILQMKGQVDLEFVKPKDYSVEGVKACFRNASDIASYVGAAVRKLTSKAIQVEVADKAGKAEDRGELIEQIETLVEDFSLTDSRYGKFVRTRYEQIGVDFKVSPEDHLIREMMSEIPNALFKKGQGDDRMKKALKARECILGCRDLVHKVVDTQITGDTLDGLRGTIKGVFGSYIDIAAKRVLVRSSDAEVYDSMQRDFATAERMRDGIAINYKEADLSVRTSRKEIDGAISSVKTIGQFISLVADVRYALPHTFADLQANIQENLRDTTLSPLD